MLAPDYDVLVDSPLEIGLHDSMEFEVDGQEWVPVCPATAGPASAAVHGYDESSDRLFVIEAGAPETVWLLDHAHSLVGNWGLAIILVTFLLKLAFYPLSE